MEQQPRTPDTLRAVPHPTMLTSSGHILFRFIARLSSGPASKGLLLPFQSFRARDSQAKPSLDNSGPLPPGIQAPSPSGLPSSPEKSPAQTGLLSAPEYTVYISSFCAVLTLPAACIALIQPIFFLAVQIKSSFQAPASSCSLSEARLGCPFFASALGIHICCVLP